MSSRCADEVLRAVPAQLQQIVDLLRSIDQKLEIIASEKSGRQNVGWLPVHDQQQHCTAARTEHNLLT